MFLLDLAYSTPGGQPRSDTPSPGCFALEQAELARQLERAQVQPVVRELRVQRELELVAAGAVLLPHPLRRLAAHDVQGVQVVDVLLRGGADGVELLLIRSNLVSPGKKVTPHYPLIARCALQVTRDYPRKA
jgi:hypothetical protein